MSRLEVFLFLATGKTEMGQEREVWVRTKTEMRNSNSLGGPFSGRYNSKTPNTSTEVSSTPAHSGIAGKSLFVGTRIEANTSIVCRSAQKRSAIDRHIGQTERHICQ